jgi:hypothetical protein
MRKLIVSGLVVSLALGVGVVGQEKTSAASNQPRACVNLERLASFTPTGPHSIVVEGEERRFYEFTTPDDCPAANAGGRLALQSRGRETTVCEGDVATLAIRDSAGKRIQCQAKLARPVGAPVKQ